MLEKLSRRICDKQEGNVPTSFEQLIERYDLERLWSFVDRIVDVLNCTGEYVDGVCSELADTKGIVSGLWSTIYPIRKYLYEYKFYKSSNFIWWFLGKAEGWLFVWLYG